MDDLNAIDEARPEDRARLRAQVVERFGRLEGRSVERGAFTATITDGPYVEGHTVTLSVQVIRNSNGRDVTPPDLNPIVIVNPPLLVPDPQGTIIRLDEDGNTEGIFRFDPVAALLQTVRDLIR